ncbi:hypothetical protein GCM10010420_29580 [Streptomyces glaucosporus]|uniref:Uncharacterized protein n=1 Tax=Streptomyces glaucosporus TaxID=284044 RepID=A0ABN3ICH5_9ACTN
MTSRSLEYAKPAYEQTKSRKDQQFRRGPSPQPEADRSSVPAMRGLFPATARAFPAGAWHTRPNAPEARKR